MVWIRENTDMHSVDTWSSNVIHLHNFSTKHQKCIYILNRPSVASYEYLGNGSDVILDPHHKANY